METSKNTVEEAIRQDYADGLTYRELAKKYRKSPKSLVAILKGPRAEKEEKEVISVELKSFFSDEELKGLDSLLEIGNIKEAENFGFGEHPITEVDVRDVVFDLIFQLKMKGWKINRKDLGRFLAGKLDFAVIRWSSC